MLPSKNRLNKKEVETIFKRGESFRSDFLLLKIIKNKKHSPPRFSVIVPIKVSKKSTERNKIKRQIRESLRGEIDNIKEVDGIVIALGSILNKNFKEINKEINKLLEISNLRLKNR
ncbi:MAG: ribonuclease P protein component [Candidatus Pacebacteria bacterium]|nr:ribonuclease P protein component [Candidatus Paceibacterota bacterium]